MFKTKVVEKLEVREGN